MARLLPVTAAGLPAEIRRIDKVVAKNQQWYENNEIHHATAEGPYPHRDRFAVIYDYETTAKAVPRKGQRSKFEEVALSAAHRCERRRIG